MSGVQGSGLPSLLQSQLTAPRILPVHKVYTYAQSKLAEHQIHFQLAPIYWEKGKQQVCPSTSQRYLLPKVAGHYMSSSRSHILHVAWNHVLKLHYG